MKTKIQKLSLLFFKLFRTFLKVTPEAIKISIGKFIGFIFQYASTERRKITEDNIRKSNLQLSGNDVKDIIKQSYQNLGITLVELLTIDTYDFNSPNPKVKFNNIEVINSALQKGQGVILLSGHCGNWESLAYCAGELLDKPLNAVVKYQMNPFTDRYLRNIRQRSGNKLLDMNKAGRKMVQILRDNGIIAMITDQRAPKKDSIIMNFMGREAQTFKAPAVLALKFGAPIFTGFAVRDKNYNYSVDLVELETSDLKNDDDGVRILTKRYIEQLEKYIHENPGNWSWQHKRWQMK